MPPEPNLSIVVVESGQSRLRPAFFDGLTSGLEDGTLEVVVVSVGDPGEGTSERRGTRWLLLPPGATVPRLRGAGVSAARAPLVALTESFCIPAPRWAEAILRAHGEADAAAVGGPMDRRDGRAADWALTFCEYGRFFRRGPAGPVDDLPGVNVAYHTERLRAALGGIPEEILEIEVHGRLRERGETLWREPGAVMFDHSARPFAAARRSQYHHGRLFGGRRVSDRALLERFFYLGLAPAVPAVLLSRIARASLAAGRGRALARALPLLAVLLTAWTAGEAIGSLLGEGSSGERWT